MYAIEKFYNNICLLSNSLVIKFDLLAKYMELGQNIYNTKVVIDLSSDISKREMRYYRHISGQLYTGKTYGGVTTESDSPVMIKVIENEASLELTKELLEEYNLTRDELLKFGDYYKNLVEDNPGMRLYIHGCLFPTDIDTAIKAPNGTILAYNPTLIETQEQYLISEIEEFIKSVIKRWNVETYSASDEYYFISFLGVLFSQLPSKILALRTNKIQTNQAHTFFLESYFRSRFNLWDAVQVLSDDTIWWLYSNLDTIIKNIGKNSTFEQILEKIFDANNVGIGGYLLNNEDSELTDDCYDPLKLPYTESKGIIEIEGLNNSYNVRGNGLMEVPTLLQSELNMTNAYDKGHNDYIISTTTDTINREVNGRYATKVIDISTLKEYKGFNVDYLRILIDYWAFLLSNDLYGSFSNPAISTSKLEFTDPNNSTKYSINSKIGFYLVIKLMLHAAGAEMKPIRTYTISMVCDNNAKLDTIFDDVLYPDGLTALLKDQIVGSYPIVNKMLGGVSEASNTLQSVLDYYKTLWILSSNAESTLVSSNIRNFLYLTSLQEEVEIHPYPQDMTIDEILLQEGFTFKVNDSYNFSESIKALIALCLGIVVDDNDRLETLLTAYKEICAKLNSYTLHSLGEVGSDSSSFIYYNTNNFIKMEKGILRLLEDTLSGMANANYPFRSTFVPYIPDEEIKMFDLMEPPAQTIQKYVEPDGVFLYSTSNTNPYIKDNVASVDLLTLPSLRPFETEYHKPMVELTASITKVKDIETTLDIERDSGTVLMTGENNEGAHTGITEDRQTFVKSGVMTLGGADLRNYEPAITQLDNLTD